MYLKSVSRSARFPRGSDDESRREVVWQKDLLLLKNGSSKDMGNEENNKGSNDRASTCSFSKRQRRRK